MYNRQMSPLNVMVALTTALLLPAALANDDFIRFYTDSGSIVEIENRALEPNANSPVRNLFAGGPTTNQGGVATPNNQGLAQEHRIETRAIKQRFCGELLVNALALVCKGNYRKRGEVLNAEDMKEMEGYDSYNEVSGYASWPEFLEILKNANNPYRVASSGGKPGDKNVAAAGRNGAGAKIRAKRGVVDECCKKPCSTVTLSQYCSIA